jgi:hypothetical protein
MDCPVSARNLGGTEVKDLPEGVIVSEMEMRWGALCGGWSKC